MFLGISLLLSYWAMKPVERAWKQQRQFVADASHELKTPLTVVMANAQMLSQPEFSEEQKRQFTASIQTMSQQMRGLVEDMLELARADSGESREDFKELDFSRLVSDCVLLFEPVMFEKELAFDYQIEDGIMLKGREQQLRQLTDILLDNAAKYSLAGGSVSLKLKHLGGRHCQLTVSNPAPEMSREECRDVFKRFYRTDKARSRDGSYGLGLSIAESIVKAHGGKISCEYNQGVICFILQLVIER
jgi:signal transduction histidine kinase